MAADARALAGSLARRDDDDLARLFASRSISATAAWHDFFDAADALLDDTAIDRVLSRLPIGTLSVLARAVDPDAVEEETGTLRMLALVDENDLPYRAVARRASAALPADIAAVPDAPGPEPAGDLHAAAAAERAFATVASLSDVLFACLHGPLSRTGAGIVSALDRRSLVDAGAVDDAVALEDLIHAADAAGLLTSDGQQWLVTDAGDAWMRATTTERWATVVRGIRDTLPPGLRRGAAVVPPAAWPAAYPLDPTWADRAALLRRQAERWALLTPEGTEPAWARPLREGGEPDADALGALLPQEIDRVYLQADLTAIAPGPLAPALDLRLRAMATRESRAQASTYRFSERTLSAAVADGETHESLRAFLGELSLTGIPQPLDYLIERAAARHGLVRVHPDAEGARVDGDDSAMISAIAVDQSLSALGLIPDGASLRSRVSRDTVYWALAHARYPVVAVDAHGAPQSPHQRRLAPRPDDDAIETYAPLLRALRAAHDDDAEAAWMTRELETAVRGRTKVALVIAFPDGSDREVTLEATGMGGGRLRGRDVAGDTERTLPISSIKSVRAAE